MVKNKYFKNITSNTADFYVYGSIVDKKWFADEESTEIDVNDFKKELDELNDISDLNIYINSPGGSVFASSTIVSLLKRFRQETGAKIHAYVDGLCASAATYLAMVADDINIYQNSFVMIHKPMTVSWGNAEDLQKDIDTLNTIENNMMIPMYMSKSKVTEEEIKDFIAKETWFSGNKDDSLYFGNFFNANFLDDAKEVNACVSKKLFENYKNIPNVLKNKEVEENVVSNDDSDKKTEENNVPEPIDYSEYEGILSSLKNMEV